MEDNVRAGSFFLLIATMPCPSCGAVNRVLALALPEGHEVVDEFTAEWIPMSAVVMLSFVARIPAGVIGRLRDLAAGYHLDPLQQPAESYWVNTCLQCAARLDDELLHSEPDVAFLPSSEARAAQIELHHVIQPITACARGLSLAPQFFYALRRA